jgi:hypothetical protein
LIVRAAPTSMRRQSGNALIEVIVAMLVFLPFILGLPLVGKQLDVKHKTYDAARYSVWERSVWRDHGSSNRKSAEDITLEARDRTLGHPRAGLLPASQLRAQGVTENPLWLDAQVRLLNYTDDSLPLTADHTQSREPVRVGLALVPAMAYEDGVIASPARLVQLQPLGMTERAFARTTLRLEVRAKLAQLASRPPSLSRSTVHPVNTAPLIQQATAALLSDSWSARDEAHMRTLVDRLTVDEAIEIIEAAARPIGALALGKGEILYGEGQYGWNPEFEPRSNILPRAYVHRR